MPPENLEDQLVADLLRAGYGAVVKRAEVQRILSVSRAEAYRLIRDGQLDSIRLKTQFRVPLRSVARFVALGVVPPKPRP